MYQDSTDVIRLDDESVEGRIAGGAVGALQGINPVAALKLGGTALSEVDYIAYLLAEEEFLVLVEEFS